MAERADGALPAARSVGRQCSFGVLPQRSKRPAHTRSALTAFARRSALQERDLTDCGASSSLVYRLAAKVVGNRVGGFCLSGCHLLAGEDRSQGGFGAGVGGIGSESGWAEGGVGLGAFAERVERVLGWFC